MRQLILMIYIAGCCTLQGQNQLDDAGRKTGHWKVDYPNGNTQYEATFHQGNPVGEMVRYYESGGVRVRMVFDPEGDRSYTRLFYKNGKPAAEGWYVNQEKDSVWTYYSEFDGTVRIREPYRQGKLHGIVRSYYSNGVVSEEVSWQHNMKMGSWKLYYENGARRMESQYEDNMLNGPYIVFYADSTLKVKGNYVDDLNEGTWSFFNDAGEEVASIEYVKGEPVDQEKFQQIMQDSLKRFELMIEAEPEQEL